MKRHTLHIRLSCQESGIRNGELVGHRAWNSATGVSATGVVFIVILFLVCRPKKHVMSVR